ncbi:related to Acyl-coenzyme A:6-aminopenicillanic-acid-acyltransferase 40 kDa form [Phialocephala subalpina]|uniref:Related to Acyl-coenzyme A:6-aminopenicillanic-acid-acyltransferase 40 kDa form n=1 Tax=Phialocephala subalpina TaxID=576137 RepID=A0A1L7XRS9_9HELO|nr:related to Acyl-coenzyme A:6-aminopenicillanic-acid-acyltransferase 40 kDa form [Phialocephala subalpina]
MLEVDSTGTSHEIGVSHGSIAKAEIARSITFYQNLFQKHCSMDWETVKSFALKYQTYLSSSWPQYVSEMEGVAQGAGVTYGDILALNVRTEIAFGNFSDGCTALSWKGAGTSILGQNWDWNTEQSENLIHLKIKKGNGLSIQMITEAGIIGKIGMNSLGVACTLNALKARGVSFTSLPCHLALRTVMESSSRSAAITTLSTSGVASACHILVADSTGGTGLECSSIDIVQLPMNDKGIVTHTNHCIVPHAKGFVEEPDWLPDTRFRLRRIEELLNGAKEEEPSVEVVEKLLADEQEGDGAAICRTSKGGNNNLATLFSVVMDLKNVRGRVKVGRPARPDEKVVFDFA